MKAAIVRELGRPPSYGDFEDPTARPQETIVTVAAAAVSVIARSRASGRHYSDDTSPPFVPGIDGVGRTEGGRRVYFGFARAPFGSLAERVPVASRRLVDLPDDLDDVTAAAAANPGMSCWIPLTRLAPIPKGESVLVNGATGVAGRMGVQVARYLGAEKVIATGRNESKLNGLSSLGADVVIPWREPETEFRAAVRQHARDDRIGVVLDYLWGPSAESIVRAFGGPDAPRGPSRVRFVQVGGVAGPTITLVADALRSSGLEILGSGLGSSTLEVLVAGIGEFLEACAKARFRVDVEVHPLSDIERTWDSAAPDRRLVYTVP